MNQYPIALLRDNSGTINVYYSQSSEFISNRVDSDFNSDSRTVWTSERVMMQVPLFVSDEIVYDSIRSEDYQRLPYHLKSIMEQGILRTSGEYSTEYSVLMNCSKEKDKSGIYEGRTGVLFYKNEPVIVNVENNEFLVEIKGVGSVDGNNEITDPMVRNGYNGDVYSRVGSLTATEGKNEYDNLEAQRQSNISTFILGESPRAAAIFYFENEIDYGKSDIIRDNQSYVLRLTPSNVRKSFVENSAFLSSYQSDSILAEDIALHWSELALLPETLIHRSFHAENILWTGQSYVLTDFGGITKLIDFEDPLGHIAETIDYLRSVFGILENAINTFYECVAQNLGLEWNIKTGKDGFIDALWIDYLVPRLYEDRINAKHVFNTIQSEIKYLNSNYDPNLLQFGLSLRVEEFMKQEILVLELVNDPKAEYSLEIAQEKLSEAREQKWKRGIDTFSSMIRNGDTHDYFKEFFLPYMNVDPDEVIQQVFL